MKLIMEHFPRSEMEITNLDLVLSLISGLDNLGEPEEMKPPDSRVETMRGSIPLKTITKPVCTNYLKYI